MNSSNIDNNPLKFIYNFPFLSSERCDEIITKANLMDNWSKNRHKHYPTTDIPLQNIDNLDLRQEIENICKIAMREYKLTGVVNPFDLFVVKYSANGQSFLDIHRDTSELSFIILLSDPSDFEGGGTFYEVYNKTFKPQKGEILFHCGKLRHSGLKITKGTRYILIGFLAVESPLLRNEMPQESNFLHNISDRRYLDYLYIQNTISDIKIHIRIINLIERRDKLNRIIQNIKNLDIPKTWKIDTQVVIAETGENHEGYKNWKTSNSYNCENHITKYWNRDITKGEIGCFLSHMKAINSINLKNNEYLLIFEDDAFFLKDLLFRINDCLLDNTDWHILDLGGKIMDNKFKNVTFYQHTGGYSYQAHSILYNQKGLEILQNPDLKKHILPFDEFLPLLRKESPRDDLKNLYPNIETLKAIFPYEPMAYQTGEIHDTENYNQHQLLVQNNIFSRIQDDYDMINYYKFNLSQPDFNKLICQANNEIWKFQLTNVIQEKNYTNDWFIYLKCHIKLLAVHLNKPNSSLIFQHNNKIFNTFNDIIIFPSYLSVKLSNIDLYFGCGSPFY